MVNWGLGLYAPGYTQILWITIVCAIFMLLLA